ncbi:MAG: tetratricopeptide repeat protein [Deferribacteres bacterium]|nr:tetratricopeptide repeat protein [candidate division KSB1 bacterium]MCB9510254.1 tetratricopeptide repeat protein [Deferribacteres bacterium]
MSRRGESRLIRQPLHLLLVLMVAWSVAACGGSKKQTAPGEGEDLNIDQLLGIEGDTDAGQQADATPPAQDKSKDEDEVLRLLGITTDEKKDEQPAAEQANMTEPSASPLQDEVNRLQTELFEKENIIEELRKELNEKNERLTTLQTADLSGRPQAQQAPAQPVPARAGESAKDRYNQALDAYNAGRYKEAISRFNSLLSENVDASLADNCQYWIGESYFGMRNYVQALVEFEKVFRYTNSNKADAAKLKMGITYLRLNDKAAAKNEFEGLISNYPKSEYIGRAQNYLANL